MKAGATLDYLRQKAPNASGRNARCFLLKRAGQTAKFTRVAEVLDGWLFEFIENRDQTKLTIVTEMEDIGDLVAQSSFVAFGIPAGDGSFDVYSIDPTRPDVLAPDFTSPAWRLFVTRQPNERYA